MSSNWKNIGKKSGNMAQYRNIKTDKLNYRVGKWTTDSDTNDKITHESLCKILGQETRHGT